MQDPKRGVVLAGDGDQGTVRQDADVDPIEQTVLGDSRGNDVPRQPVDSFAEVLSRPEDVSTVEAVDFVTVSLPHWVDVFLGMLEGGFVQGGLLLHHGPAEIDDPLVGGASGDGHAVHPRREHVRVRSAVGIRGFPEPLPGEVARHVERTALGVAHEGHARVPGEAPRLRQIDPAPPRRAVRSV